MVMAGDPAVDSPADPFFSAELAESLRQELTSANTGAPKSSSMDMPLTERSKWALIAAESHAGSAPVTLLHILWALASDNENSVSQFLMARDVRPEQIDVAIRNAGN
jgi:hypothetical protein